jgi:glutathione synthase/RimK-type ligase-like ATP-grasp enzyme
MLLLVTNQSDLHADLVVAECARRSVPVIRLNTERYPQDVTLDLLLDSTCWSGALAVRGQPEIAINDIASVWYRGITVDRVGLSENTAVRFLDNERISMLNSFFNMLADRYWISRPSSITAASDKPQQLVRAKQLGLTVPKTILTTEPASIYTLMDDAGPFLIAKRLSATTDGEPVVYTTDLQRETLDLFKEDFRCCPTLVQERITKALDVRVTVVHDTSFAVEIHSQEHADAKVDWRRTPITNLRCLPHDLPKYVHDTLVSLTASYGLRYSASDLILTPDGNYVFLELNPNGQWAWVESLTGLPITARLIDILTTRPGALLSAV